ncbi:MAG: peptidoglycan hydrolase RipC [Actinomycetota bacterium]|nr:peptidoglycan hydrolase RipC [Actinomycetota bacterium]
MRLDSRYPVARVLTRSAIGALAGFAIFSGVITGPAWADPAEDATAKLNELSRQAEQTTEAMHSAQLDLNDKLAAQRAADKKHTDDQAAVDAAKAHLSSYQDSVNKLAAATYMGGHVDGMEAILTAGSPQGLIDKLAVQRVMAAQMASQMKSYRIAGEQAAKAERESAKSAADAKSAAEQAAAVRASLQSKQSQLQVQIAVVKSQYLSLTADQRTALANPGPAAPAAAPGPGAPAPEAAPPGTPPGQAPGEAPPAGGMPGMPGMAPGGVGGGDRATVVQAALTQVGSSYVWGGASPGAFDCSGLVMWAFQQAGISLPHSSQAQAQGGQPVALSDLQPGDVVTFYNDASHSGIYVGDGMVIHSSTYGVPVRVVPMGSAGPIHDARRY